MLLLDLKSLHAILTLQGEDSKCICDVSAPLTWAEKHKKAFDVIIVMTDFRHPRSYTDLPASLRQYRHAVGVPHAK